VVAIGLIELRSIAKGVEAADAMLKAAYVKLITAQPICPGKYIILVSGEVGSVKSAMQAGIATGKEFIVDELLLANVHQDIFPAITSTTKVEKFDALGIVETFSVASSIIGADAAAKAAEIKLVELRLAKGLAGKAYFTMTGSVGDIKAAVSQALNSIKESGFLCAYTIIPSPHAGIKNALV